LASDTTGLAGEAPLDGTETLAHNLLHLATLQRALAALDGVPCCAVKGAALLATAYEGDLGARRMDDVDLVLPPGSLPRAYRRLVAGLGFHHVPDSGVELAPPPGHPGRDLLRLDLHDRLPHGGRPEAAAFLTGRQDATVAGWRLPVPSPEDHLLYVVGHALLWHQELRSVRLEDIRRLAALTDPVRLRRVATRAGLAAVLRCALLEAQRVRPTASVQRCLLALPAASVRDRVLAHLLRRRLARPGRGGGTGHLRYAVVFGNLPDLVAHVVRRAWLGPARAQLREAGIESLALGPVC
jgi:hypothetical protein